MVHSELNTLDLVIVAVYLLAMVAVGVYSVKRIKNTGDYWWKRSDGSSWRSLF